MTTPSTPNPGAAVLYPNANEQQTQVQTPPAGPVPSDPNPGAQTPPVVEAKPEGEVKPESEVKPTETPPVETKPEDVAAKYADLGFPEDFKPNDALLGKFRDMAAKANMDPDQAKALAGLYVEALNSQKDEASAQMQKMVTDWHNEVMAFPEFAAGQRERTTNMVGRVMEEFGTPEGRQWLAESGVGNNPHLVRLVLNLTNALMEGEPTPAGNPPAPAHQTGRQPGVRPTAGQLIYGDAAATMTAR